MQVITLTYAKSFNPQLLDLEVIAAGLTLGESGRILGWGWAGFVPPSGRYRIDPFTETTVIGATNVNGVITETTAEPGELHVKVQDDWTAGETTTLNGVLTAHDYTNTAPEQDRQAQDTLDADDLLALLEAGPPYAFTQDQIAQSFRLILRILRGEEI